MLKGNHEELFYTKCHDEQSREISLEIGQTPTDFIEGIGFSLPIKGAVEATISLNYIEGNTAPYFSLLYNGSVNHGGLYHHFPQIEAFKSLHLAFFDGCPLYVIENGWCFVEDARKHASESEKKKHFFDEEKRSVSHLSLMSGISEEKAWEVVRDTNKYAAKEDFMNKIAVPNFPSLNEKANKLLQIISNREAALGFFGKDVAFRFFKTATHDLSPHISGSAVPSFFEKDLLIENIEEAENGTPFLDYIKKYAPLTHLRALKTQKMLVEEVFAVIQQRLSKEVDMSIEISPKTGEYILTGKRCEKENQPHSSMRM